MAEKRFLKGLFKDTGQLDQPANTWRYALNALLNEQKGAISNESGTDLSGYLKADTDTLAAQQAYHQEDVVIGAVEIDNDRTILFVTDSRPTDESAPFYSYSKICLWEGREQNQYDKIKILYSPDPDPASGEEHDLKFSTTHPIEGTYKINGAGDVIIYWTDDLNPPRALNIDRQLRSMESSSAPINQKFRWLYGVDPVTAHRKHINLLNLFPSSGPIPSINFNFFFSSQETISEGGGLLTGVYYLALAYVDEDFVVTNFLSVSNPVSIVDEFDSNRPTTKKDGAESGSQTSKSITWRASNLNLDYKYLRPMIIRKMGDAVEAFQLTDKYIGNNTNLNITYTGIEGFVPKDIKDVMIDTVGYEKAKTISQMDDILYLGNLTGNRDLGYQKYANNIKASSRVMEIENFDTVYLGADTLYSGGSQSEVDLGNTVDHTLSYRYSDMITKYKGYKRDEVYAFYIAFILEDGSMSYAYHIPGREEITYDYNEYPLYSTNSTPKAETSIIPLTNTVSKSLKNLSTNSKMYHFYDSSFQNSGANRDSAGNCRHMNFWENINELYPTSDDFEIWDKSSFTSITTGDSMSLVGDLYGDNVRHHHFPSNDNEHRTTISSNSRGSATLSTFIPSAPGTTDYTGNFRRKFGDGGGSYRYWGSKTYSATLAHYGQTVPFGVTEANNATNPNGYSTVPFTTSGNDRFVATYNGCQVTVTVNAQLYNDSINCHRECWCRLRKKINNATSNADTIHTWISDGAVETHTMSWSGVLNLGDELWVEHSACQGGNCNCHNGTKERRVSYRNNHSNGSYMHFVVDKVAGSGNDLYDLEINHDVDILGITFEDIYIPRSYYDKIQGFRIYYAKKDYTDRRILGQSVVIPLMQKNGILGTCLEAQANANLVANSAQAMQTLDSDPEDFLIKDAYSKAKILYQTAADSTSQNNNREAYSYLSFYDFTLLRTHSSLAPATHVKVEYAVDDWTYNGPGINQNKKMLSVIDTGQTGDDGLYKITEKWGWDAATNEQNCYPKQINSALFVGGSYFIGRKFFGTTNECSRLLKQKAKSYIKGDSIYGAGPLGFPGKVANNFGDSSIILGLKDGSELPSLFGADWDYGNWVTGSGFELINYDGTGDRDTFSQMGGIGNSSGHQEHYGHYSYILNLHSFKTDVHNAIDNQELVWTGFEVVGDDINNFLFEDQKYLDESNVNPTFGNDWRNDIRPYDAGTTIGFLSGSGSGATGTVTVNAAGTITAASVTGGGSGYLNNPDITFQNQGPGNGVIITPTIAGGILTGLSVSYPTNSFNIETGEGPSDDIIFGGDTFICRYGVASAVTPLDDQTSAEPEHAIHYHIVESNDNINFRHTTDDSNSYFPGGVARQIIKEIGSTQDFNDKDNVKYNSNYSELNDIRTAIPLPLKNDEQDRFPTRTVRSAKNDVAGNIDNYRVWLANQYKDLPKNRGQLWKLATFNNLLYFHMEESLFAAKGKQSMQMKDGSSAFVGSGDIFSQEPDEVIQTKNGYGGTTSQAAAITTRHGYFFVDKNSKKVFMMADKMLEISKNGMENWFKDNMEFELVQYGGVGLSDFDNPIEGLGYHSVWDPYNKRILLTKRDLLPTEAFLQGTYLQHNVAGHIRWYAPEKHFQIYITNVYVTIEWTNLTYFYKTGWTLSYYPEVGVWGSFHSYIPYMYFSTGETYYSISDSFRKVNLGSETLMQYAQQEFTEVGNRGIYKHNFGRKGRYHLGSRASLTSITQNWLDNNFQPDPFEFQFIYNETKNMDSLTGSLSYTMEVFNSEDISILNHGFTSFYIYNTMQISGDGTLADDILEYLVNVRRIGNSWKINGFRDLAAIMDQTGTLNLPNTDAYYMSTNTNVIGGTNVGTMTTSDSVPMHILSGMTETPNPAYIDNTKTWNQRRKFIDKWIGIHFVYNNISNNLLNLYSASADSRKLYR
jgi:hypothetical protein